MLTINQNPTPFITQNRMELETQNLVNKRKREDSNNNVEHIAKKIKISSKVNITPQLLAIQPAQISENFSFQVNSQKQTATMSSIATPNKPNQDNLLTTNKLLNKENTDFLNDDTELFTLTKPYNKTENLNITYNKRKINLYPTKTVLAQIQRIKENNLRLEEEITKLFDEKVLKIHTDTTIYYPLEFSIKNKKINVINNKLTRLNRELEDCSYIFVLSKANNLFVTQKKTEAVNGRIHHSTLVKGEPVRTGGMIKVKNFKNGEQQLQITNESGHYKPSPQSIEKVVTWLKNEGLKFERTVDRIEITKFGEVRTVVVKTYNTNEM